MAEFESMQGCVRSTAVFRAPQVTGPWPQTLVTLILMAFACLSGCSEERGYRFGGIEGRAVFIGPVANAPVTLIRIEEGRAVETMATGRTDADGHFVFRPLVADHGRYRVVVELTDLPWSYRGRSGLHAAGTSLSATLTDYGRYDEREISVSAYTTLTDALSDTLRRTDAETDGEERARAGFIAHLQLDPAQTTIGEPLGDIARDPTRHRLLVDAFDVLCDQLGESAGRPAQYFNPGQVLMALVEDARGTAPSGRFDGQGPTGTVYLEADSIPLAPETLRAHLAASVLGLVEADPRWATLTAASVAPITRHLTCSSSSLFAACDPTAAGDPTPPIIDAIDPEPGVELSGVVDIRVRAYEPDGTLAQVEFTLVNGARRESIPALPGPGYAFRIDTNALQGVDRLDAEVRAVNTAGLETRRSASWPLADRAVGTLRGFVYKGRARRAQVEAFDVTDPPILLSSGTTDETGAFALNIVAYQGPVRLVVSDDVSATAGSATVYDDEVRGERRWRTGRTLQALVPEFRSGSPPAQPIIVTPFSDMALAFATHASNGGGDRVDAYELALTSLADQLGLEATAQALLTTHPAPTAAAAIDFEAAERLAFALGCFSAQAQALGEAQLSSAGDAFDALDLVALYRLDLETDGMLDGRTGSVAAALPVTGGEVRLPEDPFRADFVAACGRWLQHPANGMALDQAQVVRHLQRLSSFARGPLYDPGTSPPPFDDTAPSFSLSAEVVPAGEAPEGAPPGAVYLAEFPTADQATAPEFAPARMTTVRGPVKIVLEVSDPSGVGEIELGLLGLAAGVDGGSLQREDLSPTRARVTLTLAASQLGDRRHALKISAKDLLGNEVRSQRQFAVDNTPPSVEIEIADDRFYAVDDRTYTASAVASSIEFSWNDLSGVRVLATFGGDPVLDEPDRSGDDTQIAMVDFGLVDEGERTITVEVTDLTGLRTTASRAVVIDRQPPVFNEIPTTWLDEIEFRPDRSPSGQDQVFGSHEGVQMVRRWQTAWGPESSNPVELQFELRDGDGLGQSPPEGVQLRLSVCRSNPDGECNPGEVPQSYIVTALDPVFPILAGPRGADESAPRALNFDPILEPPPPGYFAVRLEQVSDLAGNRVTLDRQLVYQFQVIAPPLEIEIQTAVAEANLPANMISMAHLDIAGGDLVDLISGDKKLHLYRILVSNPHDIAVDLHVELPTSYLMTSVVQERFAGEAYTPPFNFQATICSAAADAPLGTLAYRPLIASECGIEDTPVGQRYFCRTCLPDPEPSDMTRMNLTLAGRNVGYLQERGQVLNGALVGQAKRWRVSVPANASKTLELGLNASANALNLAHASDEQTEFGQSAQVLLENGYRYLPPTQLLPARWLEGSAYIAVTSVTLAPVAQTPIQAASALRDTLTLPQSVPAQPAATTMR